MTGCPHPFPSPSERRIRNSVHPHKRKTASFQDLPLSWLSPPPSVPVQPKVTAACGRSAGQGTVPPLPTEACRHHMFWEQGVLAAWTWAPVEPRRLAYKPDELERVQPREIRTDRLTGSTRALALSGPALLGASSACILPEGSGPLKWPPHHGQAWRLSWPCLLTSLLPPWVF